MGKRAERVDETRLRITEAAVRLHTTIGPAESSLSAVAGEAGVTRLTLYRHFPTRDELFAACMGHWQSLHPAPNSALWASEPDIEKRVRRAITDMYRWFGANGDDLYPIYRDADAAPRSNLDARESEQSELVGSLLSGVLLVGRPGRRARAAAGHALSFWTWRSLVVEQRLSSADAVDLAAGFVLAALRDGGAINAAGRSRGASSRAARAEASGS